MKSLPKKPLIGFIGQGFIGKNYADDFENRGYKVIRYSKEPEYSGNKDAISKCDIVFIAVPTPTTPDGFDGSLVQSVVPLVGKGKIAVIKSTVLPGTTKIIQKNNHDIFVLHSPEFLIAKTAAYGAANPERNIVGIPINSKTYKQKAQKVLSVLPEAPYQLICDSNESELIKYGGNCFLYTKVVFMNMLYDYAEKMGCDWNTLADAISHDPRIGTSHMHPKHDSGRGAGGGCFIKDFEAFIEGYGVNLPDDSTGLAALNAVKEKNYKLLKSTKKDLDILKKVTGK